jgi:hypothetical protein
VKASVWATLTREGFHHWPDAPEADRHLRHEHRHLFYLRAETAVEDHDREISFEELRTALDLGWPGPALGRRSCEQVAADLSDYLSERFGRPVSVTVSEDGEAGATVVP